MMYRDQLMVLTRTNFTAVGYLEKKKMSMANRVGDMVRGFDAMLTFIREEGLRHPEVRELSKYMPEIEQALAALRTYDHHMTVVFDDISHHIKENIKVNAERRWANQD